MVSGGSAVTLTGSGFLSGISIYIGTTACTNVTLVSSTALTCTMPSMGTAGSYGVTVQNSDSQISTLSAATEYRAAPTVTSVLPSTGITTDGTSITLAGSGFKSGIIARIDGTTCITPPHSAGTVSVSVTNSEGQSGSASNARPWVARAREPLDPPRRSAHNSSAAILFILL